MTNSPEDLATLLRAVAVKDRAAFARLYDLTSSKLFGIALRILGNRPLAEDVLQDVYIKVWRDAERFDTARGGAMAWMTVMTRNHAIDVLRRTGRQRHDTLDGDGAMGGVAEETTTQCIDRVDILRGLAALEPQQSELVVRAYIEGLSREELAEIYGHPVGTIKSRLRSALAKLKAALDGDSAR